MSKHTPGPWESGINPKGEFSNGVVVRPAGEFPHGLWIADCGSSVDAERLANARLISAAPDMMEALKRVDVFLDALNASYEFCEHSQSMADAVKSSLSKAEGKLS